MKGEDDCRSVTSRNPDYVGLKIYIVVLSITHETRRRLRQYVSKYGSEPFNDLGLGLRTTTGVFFDINKYYLQRRKVILFCDNSFKMLGVRHKVQLYLSVSERWLQSP